MESIAADSPDLSFLDIYRNKRVLVTGDTGFKGSWLSLWLHGMGAEVVGYALPPKQDEDHFNVIGLDKKIQHIDGDVRDITFLKKVFDDFQPEFLFHLAAQPLVKMSYDDPKLTFDTNVGGAVNILEAVRSTLSLRSVIFVTSDKCYKNKEWIWGYRENDELGGHDPYSASKAAAEVVLSAYQDSYFRNNERLGVASVRAGNVIGGGDWSADRIVPDCIRSLKEEKPILIRNPNATRPWQHVLEPLLGYLSLASKMFDEPAKYWGAYNFGPQGKSIKTVGDLVEKVIACWGRGEMKCESNSDNFHESSILHLNCDKSYQTLGWSQRWDFDDTITKTVEWYKEVLAGKPAISITERQINDYMRRLDHD